MSSGRPPMMAMATRKMAQPLRRMGRWMPPRALTSAPASKARLRAVTANRR